MAVSGREWWLKVLNGLYINTRWQNCAAYLQTALAVLSITIYSSSAAVTCPFALVRVGHTEFSQTILIA